MRSFLVELRPSIIPDPNGQVGTEVEYGSAKHKIYVAAEDDATAADILRGALEAIGEPVGVLELKSTEEPTPTPGFLRAWFDRLRTAPWVVFVIVGALLAAFLPVWPDGLGGRADMSPYVVSWFGGVFQTVTGGLAGFWFTRRVMKLNMSSYENPLHRAIAGVGQAIVIAAFAYGVAAAL